MSYVPNVNRKSLVATSISPQDFTTEDSNATVSGTEITYTPHRDATHVIYRCQFSFGYYTAASVQPYLAFTLEDNSGGGSFADITGYVWEKFSLMGAQPEDLISLVTILPSWTGERSLRIKAQNFSTSGDTRKATLHEHQTWEGSSAPFEFYPSVSCTSVLNGNP